MYAMHINKNNCKIHLLTKSCQNGHDRLLHNKLVIYNRVSDEPETWTAAKQLDKDDTRSL